jgi:hypothetical protein
MGFPERQLISKLHLGGTLFERLIKHPEDWANPETFEDSPDLMRYAMDVRQALVLEGWQPPTQPSRRKL